MEVLARRSSKAQGYRTLWSMLGGGLEVVFVLTILKKAKKGEEKGRKKRVQKKRVWLNEAEK